MKKVELLAPAGNLDKLKIGITYGADAVYIGGEEYSLRSSSDNFSLVDMEEGLEFAHSRGKRVYLTMNIIPHNQDLLDMADYIEKVKNLGVDAIILSDPGVYSIVKEIAPNMEIHLSTQANNTNWRSSVFWHKLGVNRIVLARELSLNEIKEIRAKTPEGLEFEIFVHGAMCISYSGRCLLSNYMTNRDSNKGECAQPCRWKYYLMEEKRPGQYMPVVENDRGTYIYNSKDLCMLEHIPQIINAGVTSLKIEGRMKSSFYVASVVKAYRQAIDSYYESPENYNFSQKWLHEVNVASHREYTTGFYFGKPTESGQNYEDSSYVREYDYLGIVLEYDKETGIAKVQQRNRMFVGDEIEVSTPTGDYFKQKIISMKDKNGNAIEVAQHALMIVYMPVDREVTEYTILRKEALVK